MKRINNKLQVLLAVNRAAAVVSRKLSVNGLSINELAILSVIYQNKDNDVRRSDLADSVGLTASGVTRLILPMEKLGIVVRKVSKDDSRTSTVHLTKAGKEVYEDALDWAEQKAGNIVKNDGSLSKLQAMLEEIAQS